MAHWARFPQASNEVLTCVCFSAEEEAVLESILRDRSHIEETLRLAADDKAGDFAGEDVILT